MFYTLTNRDGQQTLSVFGETFEKVVAATHPNFTTLVNYLTTTEPHDEEHVRGLVDPTVGIGQVLQQHFGDRVAFDMHHLYLDGLKVEGGLANAIKQRMLAADQDWERFVRFLVNLDENPSYKAQQAVWRWVERHGLTITEDGCFIGYKGVNLDGTSKSSGPNNYINGEYFGEPGVEYHVPHEIGTVVSKKRAQVDDNTAQACSVGLHVGTREYATNFAPRLLTVKINPADVVSVPDRDLEVKIRVCKYEVLELAKHAAYEHTSYDPNPETANKSEERVNKEADLADLTEEQRKAYNHSRKAGQDHDVALDFALDDTRHSFEEQVAEEIAQEYQEPEEAYEALTTDTNTFVDAEGGEHAYSKDEATQGSLGLGVQPSADFNLSTNAGMIPDLQADLEDTRLGHKPLARKWANLTTEASVRRYRKSNGIKTSFAAKVKDAL